MTPNYDDFFEVMEEALEKDDLKQFRKLKNKYYQYFKHAIRAVCDNEFSRGRDTNIEFRRLSDD
jgi:hypothetical protein